MDYEETKDFIRNSLEESTKKGNVDIFYYRMIEKAKLLSQADRIIFLKAFRDVQSEDFNTYLEYPKLEPYYSLLSPILNEIAENDKSFYLTKGSEQFGIGITASEIFQNGAKVRNWLNELNSLDDDEKVSKELDIIHMKYQHYKQQKRILENLIKFYPKKQRTEILEKLQLSDEFRHIRNAMGHSHFRIISDKKIVELKDRLWKKQYAYSEISILLIQLLKWSVAFDTINNENMKV